MQKIKIESKEEKAVQFGIQVIFHEGKNKYSFYNTKKDGSFTKAWEQYRKYGFSTGDLINAEVKEEQESFTNEKGKLVNFTRRTILYFNEVEHSPDAVFAPKLNAMSMPMLSLEQKVDILWAEHEKGQKEEEPSW